MLEQKVIRYFDVSPLKLPLANGDMLSHRELIACRAVTQGHLPVAVCDDPWQKLEDPAGRANSGWEAWFTALASVVWGISGILPTRSELVLVREMVRLLPSEFKRTMVDKNFVLSFLPYVVIGFRFHSGTLQQTESNLIRQGANFLHEFYPSQTVEGYNFFCSHRAPQDTHPYSLAEHVNLEKAERALNLLLGLVHNAAAISAARFVTFQQTATESLVTSLFPEVVHNYIQKNSLHILVNLIDRHAEEVETLFVSKSDNVCAFKLLPLDEFNSKVSARLEERVGAGWNNLQPVESSGSKELEFASWVVLPEVQRLMPYYEQAQRADFKSKLYHSLTTCALVAKDVGFARGGDFLFAIGEAFLSTQAQTAMARALFETEFYASWGELCAKEQVFAIGFDRDCDRYQFQAWNLGYVRAAAEATAKLLYARRTHPEFPDKLQHLNFRQFWR